jgi:hypothetical protein
MAKKSRGSRPKAKSPRAKKVTAHERMKRGLQKAVAREVLSSESRLEWVATENHQIGGIGSSGCVLGSSCEGCSKS